MADMTVSGLKTVFVATLVALVTASITGNGGSAVASSVGVGPLIAEASHEQAKAVPNAELPAELRTSANNNKRIMDKVDKLVRQRIYDKSLIQSAWQPALKRDEQKILASKNLIELDENINHTLASMHSSHCEFVTINDETYYFLHGLFCHREKLKAPIYTGFMTGPPRFAADQVRYVLNGSPASTAEIEVGDRILTVNGRQYLGQMDFLHHLAEPEHKKSDDGKSDQKSKHPAPNPVVIGLERGGKKLEVKLTPLKQDVYRAYCEATEKSARSYKVDGFNIGYVHHWCGGQVGHEAIQEVLNEKLGNTDGLILDLRDGYGGNGLDDLDYFYRPPLGYPVFISTTRDGKKLVDKEFYDRPVVALINDGSRSGKELLAFSLKRTGRAKLVGINTAGAFLGGSFNVIDDTCALYLPVIDCTVGGVRLEGVGVAPDVPVDDRLSAAGKQEQLDKAQSLLIETLQQSKSAPNPQAQN